MLKAATSLSSTCMQALLCPLTANVERLVLNDVLGQQGRSDMTDTNPTCQLSPWTKNFAWLTGGRPATA